MRHPLQITISIRHLYLLAFLSNLLEAHYVFGFLRFYRSFHVMIENLVLEMTVEKSRQDWSSRRTKPSSTSVIYLTSWLGLVWCTLFCSVFGKFFSTRLFIKYLCFFRKILKYSGLWPLLFSPCVSVCTPTRQVEHKRWSRTGRVQKNHKILGKNTYLMNTLYINWRLPIKANNILKNSLK